ncbi:MAG TPA: ATP-dependent DNA helicase [Lachnospiraceae bacterium]|nr:ATP-dependent DNA helicase [Lachnospiraceae bacterium]
MDIYISVRNLVEFILRSGNIDNRRTVVADNVLQEGSRIHRMLQKKMGSNYDAEVSLKHVIPTENYNIIIDGRADGVINEGEKGFVIDEIKSTFKDISRIKEPLSIHLAQAKCYAYIYALQNNLDTIGIRMTYCHIETEELKYFFEDYTFGEIEGWFLEVIEKYKVWADFQFEWKTIRTSTIKSMEFPFPYREGQKDLVTYVYQTIYHKRKLFLEAPTGVGKTISTIFPAIKAIGEDLGEKIFYLTAKTITRTVAEDTYQLLRSTGLRFKTVTITAKDKICPREEVECNPIACPLAKGHFNRINDAIYDLLTNEDNFTRENIEIYAIKHQVCPFEMCLDMSLFSDGIICDYNYVFDPHVYLRRYFSEGNKGVYFFLIDEAHNLVDRGRQMYSATLRKEDFLALKKELASTDIKMEKLLEKCNKELLFLKRECETYAVNPYIEPFVISLNRLCSVIDKYLEDHDDGEVRKKVLEFYFIITHFLATYELLDDNYVIYTEMESDGCFALRLFCVNPSVNLKMCMAKGRSSVLFSATLLPIQYYKNLLGGDELDYEVYAQSTFAPNKKALIIGSDVTSKYSRRSDMEYHNIASYIQKIIGERSGNYMIFFPSHTFLRRVYETFMEYFYEEKNMECIVQENSMNECARELFLRRFMGNETCDLEDKIYYPIEFEEEKSLLGFCVLGGLFSEGIDLKNDSLIGAIIIGTGMPQVCNENEILKNYFDELGDSGFDYAYRYPGMNKVLQAAGRVIRTQEDIGVIALLDERFLEFSYQKMFPREWEHFEVVTGDQIAKRVERFWNEWL